MLHTPEPSTGDAPDTAVALPAETGIRVRNVAFTLLSAIVILLLQ